MAKVPTSHNKPWTPAANKELKQHAAGNTPTRIVALKMGRTPASVANHASEIGVSLKPTNQSPYGTQ